MTSLERLSNEELVDQINPFIKKFMDTFEYMDVKEIKTELLRRLNEPWRNDKK